MSFSKPNRSAATKTKPEWNCAYFRHVRDLPGRVPGPCEIGRSAIRGEKPFIRSVRQNHCRADKDYPVDYSHFNIQGTCVGAVGVRLTR